MKISTVASSTLSIVAVGTTTTSAFVSQTKPLSSASSSLRMSSPNSSDDDWSTTATTTRPDGSSTNVKYAPMEQPNMDFPIKKTTKSIAIPFANRPMFLDGTMAGDFGFDPIGFADSQSNLMNYREAEIKHARLAMLAAAGWPLSELWDAKLANIMGMDPVLDDSGRVPSVLNGGLEKISPIYWGGCIVLAAAFDIYGSYMNPLKNKDASSYIPGDFGWRAFYPTDPKQQREMRLSEIKHGRLAMLAITGFAIQEFVTDVSVIDQTPFFFKPITEFLPALFNEATTASAPDVADFAAIVDSAADTASTPSAAAVVESAASSPSSVSAVTESATNAATSSSAAVVESAASTITSTAPAPVEAVTNDASAAELAAAKQRIAELESKLSEISALVR